MTPDEAVRAAIVAKVEREYPSVAAELARLRAIESAARDYHDSGSSDWDSWNALGLALGATPGECES